MLEDFRRLPHRHVGFAPLQSHPEFRCDPRSAGLARETDPAKYRWDNRRRDQVCLFQYTLDGEGRFRDLAADRTFVLRPGQGFLAPFPSPTEYWLEPGTEWEFVYLIFSGQIGFYHTRRLIKENGYVFSLAPDSGAVAALQDLYASAVLGERPDEWRASQQAYRFLMELSRRPTAEATAAPELLRAKRTLETEYADPRLGVEELAVRAGISKYHFARRFKEAFGQPPYAYLQRLRVLRARELLAGTELPAKQIARQTGFRDYPYFCNAFRKLTGFTPAALRRQARRFPETDAPESLVKLRVAEPEKPGKIDPVGEEGCEHLRI